MVFQIDFAVIAPSSAPTTVRTVLEKFKVGITAEFADGMPAQVHHPCDPLVFAVEAIGHDIANPLRDVRHAVSQMSQIELDAVTLGGRRIYRGLSLSTQTGFCLLAERV